MENIRFSYQDLGKPQLVLQLKTEENLKFSVAWKALGFKNKI